MNLFDLIDKTEGALRFAFIQMRGPDCHCDLCKEPLGGRDFSTVLALCAKGEPPLLLICLRCAPAWTVAQEKQPQ